MDREALRVGLKAIGAALKREPAPALPEPGIAFETNESFLQPVRTSGTVAIAPQPALSPAHSSAYLDAEAPGSGSKAVGVALNRESTLASHAQAAARPANDVAFPQVRAGGSAVDAPRNAPSLLPPTTPADEEAFFHQLRAIGSVLNSQPIRASHKPVLARETREPEEAPSKPVPSSSVVERRWPVRPIPVTATVGPAAAVVAPTFRTDLADWEELNIDWRRWMKPAAIVAAAILLLFLGVRLLSPGRPTMAKQTVAPMQTAADADPASNLPKPSPSTQLIGARPSATTDTLPKTSGQPGANAANTLAPQVDSQLMNDQLTAAPRIPQDIKVKTKEEAPPPEGFSAASTVDVADSSAIGGVFGDREHPTVAYVPYPRETIAAGVADGLLMQRTQPVYPPDAWYNGITGKVALEIAVSRAGLVESVRIVSGPHVFQKPALDAVKTWRYKPYVIDNVPREFQTTVEITFDQKSGGNPLSLLHLGSRPKKSPPAAKNAGEEAQ
ncbi:MAG TPA: TonB family protein [Terriglobia bacterium]|nr:TonB family protein [Terriglobia bacterium]